MRLWIGLYLPQLPLEVFCPSWSSNSNNASVVLALSAPAAAAGVQAGMRRGGVLMLVPEGGCANARPSVKPRPCMR